MTVRMSVLELSRGSIWKPRPDMPPYLIAPPGEPWATGADCYVTFTDTSGGELSTIVADSVTPAAITFSASADAVDGIPAGSNFEVFLGTVGAGYSKIRYGKVIRREVEYPDAPGAQAAAIALNYVDTFPTLGLRSNWKAIQGTTKVYDNTSSSLPFGVSANYGLFVAQSAIRWDSPLNTDTVKSHVVLLNQGTGKCTIIVCADQRFTSYLGVQFDSGANKLAMVIGSGPTTVAIQGTALSHTVTDLADYSVIYDELTSALVVYQGTNLTPLSTFVDSAHVVPHGPGYRYAGFAFDTGVLFSPGIEVAGWQARDY